jgi:ABC-type uncharacterized transport system involved in gliding motility auxiliary subunit
MQFEMSVIRRTTFFRFAVALAVLVAVNLFTIYGLPAQIDLTGRGTYTLAPQTCHLLAALRTPLEVTVLAPRVARTAGERNFAQAAVFFRELVERCRRAQPLVHFQDLDPQESAAARQLVQQCPDAAPPCVIIRYGAPGGAFHEVLYARDLAEFRAGEDRRLAAVDCLGEQALVGALARLTAGKKQATVYMTTGHGELSLDDTDPESRQGVGILAELLQRLGCDVRPLDLSAGRRVPADSSLVVIPGGGQPRNEDETEKLGKYLRNGGKALILVDLNLDPRRARPTSTGLEELLSEFGVAVGDDRVITQGFTGDVEVASPALPAAGEHPLVRSLPQAPLTLFECRSLRLSTGFHQPLTTVVPLLVSHAAPRAWADGDFGQGPPQPGSKNDSDGPVAMAVAVERRQDGDAAPVLVVVGDAEFVANRAVAASAGHTNVSFVLSCISWLRGRRELLGDIPPRRYEGHRLTGSADEQRRIVWTSSLFLCSLIITVGATVWTSRRRG